MTANPISVLFGLTIKILVTRFQQDLIFDTQIIIIYQIKPIHPNSLRLEIYTRCMVSDTFFLLSGEGRKFSVVPLIINIGSGLALLTVATVISDLITLYCLPGKKFYNKVKYEHVDEELEKKKLKATVDEEKAINSEKLTNETTPLLDTTRFKADSS